MDEEANISKKQKLEGEDQLQPLVASPVGSQCHPQTQMNIEEDIDMLDDDGCSIGSNLTVTDEDTLLRDDDEDAIVVPQVGAEVDGSQISGSHPCDDDADSEDLSTSRVDYSPDMSQCSDDDVPQSPQFATINFGNWDTNSEDELNEKHHLWNHDEEFRATAEKFVKAVSKYGNKCIEVTQRAYNRKPTVAEFWNYYMSKTVPRQSWYGVWKVVNPGRRGWPLQHLRNGEFTMGSVTFRSELASPSFDLQMRIVADQRYIDIELFEIPLWQLEPMRPEADFFDEGISVEEGQAALKLVRSFFELYHFGFDDEDFITFFETVLYDRMELIHYLGCQSHAVGALCGKERGKIVAGIKDYHTIRNAIQDLGSPSSSRRPFDGGSQDQSRGSSYIALQMRMDRHIVELSFLMDQTMRKLVGLVTDNEDSTISNYDSILVVNSVKLADLKGIYEWFESYPMDGLAVDNIKIMDNLQAALRHCSVGATIFVVSGNYAVSGLGKLGEGGRLVGIKVSNADVTLTPTDDIGDVWMLSSPAPQTTVHLENLTLVVDGEVDRSLSSCIYVSSGRFKMVKCVIRNVKCLEGCDQEDPNSPKLIKRVNPLSRSQLAVVELQDCLFENFGGGSELDGKGYPLRQDNQ